jgi:hypothetical protein
MGVNAGTPAVGGTLVSPPAPLQAGPPGLGHREPVIVTRVADGHVELSHHVAGIARPEQRRVRQHLVGRFRSWCAFL